MSPSDEIDTSQYSPEELKAAVFEAEAAGTYVGAHVYSSRSILNCVAAGIRTLEHGNLLDEKAALAIREAGAYLVPTLVTYEMISRLGKSLGIPDNNVRKINEAKERGLEALRIAHRAGCKIASAPIFSARCRFTKEWNWSSRRGSSAPWARSSPPRRPTPSF